MYMRNKSLRNFNYLMARLNSIEAGGIDNWCKRQVPREHGIF